MPLIKKIIVGLVVAILLVSIFFVFFLDDLILLFGGTSFSLNSWSVTDDEGFAGLYINFSCSGTITVEIVGPDSSIIDSDFFFRGDGDTILHLAEYRHSVTPGNYKLRAYNNDNREIYSKTITFGGSDITILSCDQKWWKRDVWIGGYSLIGLRMTVQNNGDVPVYPSNVTVTMDSEENSSLALPVTILPGITKYVDCFIYRATEPEDSTFTINLEDKDENTLATSSFSVEVEDNVPIKQFSWRYKGLRRPKIPEPEYLHDYYSGLDRIRSEDYGLYIFDPYDEGYIDIFIDHLMFGFSAGSDVEKINYVASFVQNLDYIEDTTEDDYPYYPVETLFTGKGGGDCEDKAILIASILYKLGYDIALIRLPNHMAVGVHLSESAIPDKEYYVENYYFLETTTPDKYCGSIPSQYEDSSSEATVYPIKSRPLLIHNWEGDSLTIYTNTEMGDFVKVTLIVENLGVETPENVKVTGGFYKLSGLKAFSKSDTIPSIDPNMKKTLTLTVNIPESTTTWFKTKIYLGYDVVDEKESVSSFPTL